MMRNSPIVSASFCGSRLLITCLLLCGLSAPTFAGGAFDSPGPFIVPAAAFNLDGHQPSDYYFLFIGGYLSQSGDNSACFMAPLYLPNGTEIFSMGVSAYDISAAADISVSMSRTSWNTLTSDIMATASTSGTSGKQFPVDDTISNPTINNGSYIYRLQTCLDGGTGADLRIYAVRIETTFIFADGFESGTTDAWSAAVSP